MRSDGRPTPSLHLFGKGQIRRRPTPPLHLFGKGRVVSGFIPDSTSPDKGIGG